MQTHESKNASLAEIYLYDAIIELFSGQISVEVVRTALKRSRLARRAGMGGAANVEKCKATILGIDTATDVEESVRWSLLALAYCELGICLNECDSYSMQPFQQALDTWGLLLKGVEPYRKGHKRTKDIVLDDLNETLSFLG